MVTAQAGMPPASITPATAISAASQRQTTAGNHHHQRHHPPPPLPPLPIIAGLTRAERQTCYDNALGSALSLLLASNDDLVRCKKTATDLEELARIQRKALLAALPSQSSAGATSLWQMIREEDKAKADPITSPPARRRPLADTIRTPNRVMPSQFVAGTPGADEPPPMTWFKDLPSSPTYVANAVSPPITPPRTSQVQAEPIPSCSRAATSDCALCATKLTPVRQLCSAASVPSGIAAVDRLLAGGFRRGTITDLAGDSGSGKTQLLVQTIFHTLLGLSSAAASEDVPDWEAAQGVALLITGGRHASRKIVDRLTQLLDARFPMQDRAAEEEAGTQRDDDPPASTGVFRRRAQKRPHHALDPTQPQPSTQHDYLSQRPGAPVAAPCAVRPEREELVTRMLSNLHIAHVPSLDILDRFLDRELPQLQHTLRTKPSVAPIGLIALDDLPTILNEAVGSDMNGMMQRSRKLCDVASRLKILALPSGAGALGAAVLVVNHVVDASDASRSFASRHASSSMMTAAELAEGGGVDARLQLKSFDFETQNAHSSGLALSLCHLEGSANTGNAADGAAADFFDGDPADRQSEWPVGKIVQLGPVWTGCVQARLLLVKTTHKRRTKAAPPPSPYRSRTIAAGSSAPSSSATTSSSSAHAKFVSIRQMGTVFSSWCSSGFDAGVAHFVIEHTGIQSMGEDEYESYPALRMAGSRAAQGAEAQREGPEDDISYWLSSDDLAEADLSRAAEEAEQEAARLTQADESNEGRR